jgi:hypothetical protein
MGNCTITLPGDTGTVVLEDNTVTLSNKTIASPTITGTTTAADISGSSTLQMVGATTLGSTLSVSGAATMAGGITTTTVSGSGTLQMVGATYLGATLGVTGALTAKSTVSGAAATFTTVAGTSLALQNGGITAAGAIAGATNYSGSGTFQTVGAAYLGGTLGVTGAATFNGAVALGNATGDLIGFTGSVGSDIIPDVNDEWDLGSSSKKFNTLYVNNISSPIDVVWDVEAVGNGDTIAAGTDFALVTAGNRSNVTLPAASAGKHLRVKLSSSIGDVFVKAGSGDLIEGEPFILMESTGSAITCVAYDGQSWFIV